jgi:hypothetical protein
MAVIDPQLFYLGLFLIKEPRTNTKRAPAIPVAFVCVFPFVPSLNLISFFPIPNEPMKIATKIGISNNKATFVMIEIKKWEIFLGLPVFEK